MVVDSRDLWEETIIISVKADNQKFCRSRLQGLVGEENQEFCGSRQSEIL